MLTKKQILENLDQVKKYIEEIESKKDIEEGTEYWWVNEKNKISSCFWEDDSLDNALLNNHNVYLNESDCDKQIAKNEALNKIKTYIKDNFGEWKPNWNDISEDKITIYFNNESRCWSYNTNWSNKTLTLLPHLKSQEQAKQLIKDCEEELNVLIDN